MGIIKQNKEKNPIKRVDVDILGKILGVLYQNGECQKSVIARKCNMGYDKCVRYLDFLVFIGFIKIVKNEDDLEAVILIEPGIKFCKSKLSLDFKKATTAVYC